jgi:hypothetical protein
MLQAAAVQPGLAAACIEAGALDALVTAAATILPGGVMGATELLNIVKLTLYTLLDSPQQATSARARLVLALEAALQQSCANPLLLCKLLAVLLQRTGACAGIAA